MPELGNPMGEMEGAEGNCVQDHLIKDIMDSCNWNCKQNGPLRHKSLSQYWIERSVKETCSSTSVSEKENLFEYRRDSENEPVAVI